MTAVIHSQSLGRLMGFGYALEYEGESPRIGKVVFSSEQGFAIELFLSPVGPRLLVQETTREALKLIDELPLQTLVYCQLGASWRIGRIETGELPARALNGQGVLGDEPHYGVKFPGRGDLKFVPRSAVFVRVQQPDDDPTELLAAQTTETAFFTDSRRQLSSFAARQRAALRGVTAISSSRIELHRHQLSAVRRVLLDPVQRYLLADEVGLGKTIEAGLLIRQHLIDDGSDASVLVAVPDHLVLQWESELGSRFGVADDARVRVVAYTELDKRTSWLDPTMMVIDEAHHTAEWAYATDPTRYRLLEDLARRSRKILLLTGTPVLHHEDGFLAMLHLLDPDAYELSDRAGFRARVAARDDVADALVDLAEDAAAVFIRPAIDRLLGAFPNDHDLIATSKRVLDLAEASVADAARVEALRQLRSYLVERYRLYRRIVRTQRGHRSVQSLLPRRAGLIEIPAAARDPAREAVASLLDGWRDNVPAGALAMDSAEAGVFADLVVAALSHPSVLGSAIAVRVASLRAGRLLPAFEDEADWLGRWVSSLGAAASPDVRTAAIAHFLNDPQVRKRRAVVFVDDPAVADAVAGALRLALVNGGRVHRLNVKNPDALTDFGEASDSVLVCDRYGEDGLNLQRKQTSLIFHDVPIDTSRIEQRIARADRLEGGMTKVPVHIVCPVGAYETPWVVLLRDVVRIFNRSVAPLQYVLSTKVQELRHRLLGDGPHLVLAATTAAMTDRETGLEAELRRLQRQEVLDAPDWDDDEEQAFVASVEAARNEATATAKAALEPWLACIQMERREDAGFSRYIYHGSESKGRQTIVPLQNFIPELLPYVDRTSRTGRDQFAFGPFAFEEQSVEEGDHLLHLGHPFFDTVLAMMESDDRGKAWGTWRTSPKGLGRPDTFVRFDFLISVDLDPVRQLIETYGTLPSLRRRADAALPVEHRVVWVDRHGSLVTDPEFLAELNRPYRPVDKGGPDLNLRPERWALVSERTEVGDWQSLVMELRRRAEAAVRADPEFVARSEAGAAAVRREAERTVAVLMARASLLDGSRRSAANREVSFERSLAASLIQGTRQPRFHVDSAGALFLCSSPLQ